VSSPQRTPVPAPAWRHADRSDYLGLSVWRHCCVMVASLLFPSFLAGRVSLPRNRLTMASPTIHAIGRWVSTLLPQPMWGRRGRDVEHSRHRLRVLLAANAPRRLAANHICILCAHPSPQYRPIAGRRQEPNKGLEWNEPGSGPNSSLRWCTRWLIKKDRRRTNYLPMYLVHGWWFSTVSRVQTIHTHRAPWFCGPAGQASHAPSRIMHYVPARDQCHARVADA
jgi:hypothetical protein